MGREPLLPASVIICAYTQDRWDWLMQAIDSVHSQTVTPAELIVVVDHNPLLYQRLIDQVHGAQVLQNAYAPGLSGARNTGVLAATGEVVAFLDDDAAAHEQWLQAQLVLYDDPAVLAVGGRIDARWAGGRPAHFPEELDWIVGCSYRGLPRVAAQVRNVIGASMSFRRIVFDRVGLFDERMGRTTSLRGCEETDLCIRAAVAMPWGRVVYEPASLVTHHVPAERTTLRYMLARAWGEGTSKALITHPGGHARHLASERRYVTSVLPRAVLHNLRTGGVAGSGAILAVLGAAAGAYVLQPQGLFKIDRFVMFGQRMRSGTRSARLAMARVATAIPAAPAARIGQHQQHVDQLNRADAVRRPVASSGQARNEAGYGCGHDGTSKDVDGLEHPLRSRRPRARPRLYPRARVSRQRQAEPTTLEQPCLQTARGPRHPSA
jgi:glucosyl-dolichyl phosphate glucuronosyltransferase